MAAPVFRTDVNIRGPASHTLLDRPTNARGQSSSEYLNGAAESVNKHIDNDVKAMLEGFDSLLGLSRVSCGIDHLPSSDLQPNRRDIFTQIRDKDKYRIAQETLELEARSDVMVCASFCEAVA
jgi:hypothetical protein